ncbi:RNA-binding 28 [Olea europaea subsp. europaea]|nr:RNA-binding 28 [Olea europaea subsp. europaea]
MHRAPLEQCRAKQNQVHAEDFFEADKDVLAIKVEKLEKAPNSHLKVHFENVIETKNDKDVSATKVEKLERAPNSQVEGKSMKKRKRTMISSSLPDEGIGSEKQRVAKTVIFGGLLNANVVKEVHRQARDCSVTYPLPREVLQHHGLSQDGCKMDASSEIHGQSIWARQLGGEGSKTQKWKLMVRNLPFKAEAAEIKDMFASVGCVWEVFIPQNSETGLIKGFAFVKFMSKGEAAIKKFNRKQFVCTSGSNSVAALEDGQHHTDGEDGSSSDSEDADLEVTKKSQSHSVDNAADELDSVEVDDSTYEVDFDVEAEVARNVLKRFISSSSRNAATSGNDDPESSEGKKEQVNALGSEQICPTEAEDDLLSTVFITNLPYDIDNEEVKQCFSAFVEVQSFFPVLHQVTKGTGFLKFKTTDAANAAFSVANAVSVLAQDKALEKAQKEDCDQLLYLAKEGLIMEGTTAAEGVSASDMSKCNKLHNEKMTKLQSLKDETDHIQCAKVNERKKSQETLYRCSYFSSYRAKTHNSAAFIEFTEHQHALVAQRVLNNNPDTFGSEHRLIVEFALDNVQTLKLRKEKLQAQKASLDDVGDLQQNDPVNTGDSFANKNLRKRKPRVEKTIKNFGSKKGSESENKAIDVTTTEVGEATKKQKGSPQSRIDGILPEKNIQKGSKRQVENQQKKKEARWRGIITCGKYP